MKRISMLIFLLVVTGFVRGDANVSNVQDPVVVMQRRSF